MRICIKLQYRKLFADRYGITTSIDIASRPIPADIDKLLGLSYHPERFLYFENRNEEVMDCTKKQLSSSRGGR